jgi:4-carboxymuconolactone decarboxylase
LTFPPIEDDPMRYPRLNSETMTARQRDVAEAIDKRRVGGLEGTYVPLIYSPEIADRVQTLSEYLRFSLRVPEPLRLLAILITARRKGADREFNVHTAPAREAGFSDDKITALSEGHRPAGMTANEEIVYDYCTELNETGNVKDVTFKRVADRWGREICLELVALCGYFGLMGMMEKTVDLPASAGEARSF